MIAYLTTFLEQIELYIELFLTFAVIALFNFGGGFVMISLIGEQIIDNGWVTVNQFSDIIAISQMTPGAIAINTATYVGYIIAGVPGALAATLAIPIPSFILVLVLSPILTKYKDHGLNKMIFYGIRPVVVGLIINAAIIVANTSIFNQIDYNGISEVLLNINLGSVFIFVISFILIYKSKINPIFVIFISAILGGILFSV